jgi:hypothetical protein
MRICIENEEIFIEKEDILFGDSYKDTLRKLKGMEKETRKPDKDGLGCIFLKDVSFYGLDGFCTIWFRNNILEEIMISFNKNLYKLNKKWEGLNTKAIISKVVMLNKEELEKISNQIEPLQKRGVQKFKTNTLLITTNIPQNNKDYMVRIQKLKDN